jgi:hypothetical protein
VVAVDIEERAQQPAGSEENIDEGDDLDEGGAGVGFAPQFGAEVEVEGDGNAGTLAALAARMAAIVSARGPGPRAGVMPEICSARASSRMRGQSKDPGAMRAKALPARS